MKLPPGEFIRSAQKKYREWRAARSSGVAPELKEIEIEESEKIVRQTAYEQAVEQAQTEIENHIDTLGPYDFQKLVAELLVGIGYHVPTIAPPGPDGGIDIVAYKDPLGTSTPRIRVQVKHREQKVNVQEVRELEGLLRKEGDMGLIVSSGGFTSDAIQEIRSSSRHIETMDLDRLIQLWGQHYDSVREAGKLLLPLVKLHFLAPTEEQNRLLMWRGTKPVTLSMLHGPIYETLKRVARNQRTTTYSDIAPLSDLDMESPADRDKIRQILGLISTYEHQNGRPMLTAVVVHKQDYIPGPGFFELASHLGLLKRGQDKLAFFCGEVTRVYSHWRAQSQQQRVLLAYQLGERQYQEGLKFFMYCPT